MRRTMIPGARLTAVAALLCAAVPAAAQLVPAPGLVLHHSTIALEAQVLRGTVPVATDALDVLPGAPGIANALYQPQGFGRFPTSTSALPQGFASAVMTGAGIGGVGVSFWSAGTPDVDAHALWEQTIVNAGTLSAELEVDYTIPELEASILAGPAYGTFPPFAMPAVRSRAELLVTHFGADGTMRSQRSVFDYALEVARRFPGTDISSYVVTRSDDLLIGHGPGDVIRDGDVTGIRYAPFSSSRYLGILEPGEWMTLAYLMDVQVLASRTMTPELGYQGLVGDPFQISGTGGLTVRLANATTVPEPGTGALLVTGLCAAAAWGRRRARRTC